MPARRSESDKRMSSYMKQHKIERTTGRCAVCYKMIPNDTHGGNGARNHYPSGCISRGGTEKGI